MSDIMNNTPIDKDRLKKELSFGKRAVSITSGITTGTPVKRFNDMSTPIEKIDVLDFKSDYYANSSTDIRTLAEKINEVIDVMNAVTISKNCVHDIVGRNGSYTCTRCGVWYTTLV